MPRRLVVTGASGNVGTAVLRRLAADHPDWQVVGVCRRPPAAGEPAYERVMWRAFDIAGRDGHQLLAEAFAGADAVVHAAWLIQPSRDRDLLRSVNVGGTHRVLLAAREAGVGHVVHLSSVGVYRQSAKGIRRDESWAADGVPSSVYSQDKVGAERLLDEEERRGGGPLLTRLRPGLIFQPDAASEVARYFLGPFVPQRLVGLGRLPVAPLPSLACFQAVHADDVADAVLRAVELGAPGPFNLAAEPVVTPDRLAALLGGSRIAVPEALVRRLAAATYDVHLQPTEPGWVDLAYAAPVMSTDRARAELGWRPRQTAERALAGLLTGMRRRRGTSSPALRPRGRVVHT